MRSCMIRYVLLYGSGSVKNDGRKYCRSRSGKTMKEIGGREGARTLDPRIANAVLSQLSYSPVDVRRL